jgi:hydroxyethylthiazole kinase-like uncharacterized protein yjeF
MEADVITSRDMRALEMNSEYFGVARLQLMENAGASVAREVASRFPDKKTRIAVFCGLGGNGGDGLVATRHLHSLRYPVQVLVAGKVTDISHDAALKNWAPLQYLQSFLRVEEIIDSSQIPDVDADVVIDALLGSGLRGPPRPPILQLIHTINQMKGFCLAVDVPSGLDADSGEVLGTAVKADLTVTFHKAKPGLLLAKDHVGELLVSDIGLPTTFETLAGPGDVASVVKPRPGEAHKGDFGKLLVVGGSKTYTGAPALVALAALRTGVDLAYVAAPEDTAYAISSMSPDMITVKLKGTRLDVTNASEIKQWMHNATAMVMGPGLGLHPETTKAVAELVKEAEQTGVPLVLDADGLKAFAEFKRPLTVPLVLTPHAGEYTILTGKELPADFDDRAEKVRKTAKKLNAVVLLKGNVDLISDGKRVKQNLTGNPGMTVGGTGDVLSGIVGAFLAQRADPFEAAVAGAFINGAAGDFVRKEKGYHMVATDLLNWIPPVMDDPMAHAQVRTRGP